MRFSPRPFAATGPALLLLAAALSACASIPDLGAAPQPKTPIALASAQSLAAPDAPWPGDRWWTGYGDPQLAALIDEALEGSPTLAQARARLAKAQSAREAAGASLLPSVTGSASAAETKNSTNLGYPSAFSAFLPKGYQDNGRIAVNLDYEFDFWGRNRKAVAAATSEVQAARAEAAQARLALSTSIAAAYADYARLCAERDLAASAVTVREQTLDLVKQRVAFGADTLAEQKQAEASAAVARGELAALDESIAASRNALAALAGQGPDRGLSLQRPAVAQLKVFGLPASLPADLVGRRPDLTAARWRAQAAADRVGAAKAAFYPNINLAAYIGQQAVGLPLLFKDSSNIGSIGLAASLPIFDGGRLRAGLKGARADYDLAVADYDATLVEALRQVADAANAERALTARLAEARTALAASEEAWRVAQLRYRNGLSNYLAALTAEDAVIQNRRAVADLEVRAFALDIQLVKALGGGFVAP